MRVLFIGLGYEQLAISGLSAVLRRLGHDVGLAFSRHLFDDRAFLHIPALAKLLENDGLDDQIIHFRPDVVCFSTLTTTHAWMLDVAKRAKALTGAMTVFGGVHPSAVPDIVAGQEGVDYVVVSEGDVALPQLLDALRLGVADRPMPNVVFKRPNGEIVRGPVLPFFPDLDALPGFEKDLWADHIPVDRPYMTMSSRGCPYRCTFCFNNFFANLPGSRAKAGKYVRQRSVDHFLAELKDAKRRYKMRYVEIIDDIFTIDTPWIVEFSRKYKKEIGLPFGCFSHPKFIDAERVSALKAAGCEWMLIGVESADDSYKKKIKRVDSEDSIDRTLNMIEEAGIKIKTDHMFGLVGETVHAQEIAHDLYSRHGLARIGTFWLTYLPGTEIIQQGLSAGAITQADVDALNHGSTQFFRRQDNVADAGLRKTYLAYEFVFRLMPLFPKGALKDVNVERLSMLPPGLLQRVGFLADLAGSIKNRSWELERILSHYIVGLTNHGLEKLNRPRLQRFPKSDGTPFTDAAFEAKYRPIAAQLVEAIASEASERALLKVVGAS